MAKRRDITVRVLEYIQKRPGQYLYVQDIASELDLTEAQVRKGIYYIISTDKLPYISKKTQYGPYIYSPGTNADITAEQNGNIIFEMRGRTKKGDLIIEADDGTLYRAVELE